MAIDYRGLQYGQQYFPNEYGSANTGMGNQWADARQAMTSNDAYRGRPSWMAGNPQVGFDMPAASTNKYIQRKEEDGLWTKQKILHLKLGTKQKVHRLDF